MGVRKISGGKNSGSRGKKRRKKAKYSGNKKIERKGEIGSRKVPKDLQGEAGKQVESRRQKLRLGKHRQMERKGKEDNEAKRAGGETRDEEKNEIGGKKEEGQRRRWVRKTRKQHV